MGMLPCMARMKLNIVAGFLCGDAGTMNSHAGGNYF